MIVHVVGVGADGWDGLGIAARAAVAGAEVLMGSSRQLALVPPGSAERVVWPSPLIPALQGLLERHADRRICVLASGDPMFFGIGATLSRMLGPDRIRVLPQPSSASLACARLGWPLAGLPVVSLVGRPVNRATVPFDRNARLLVLSNDQNTPGEVAELLATHGHGTAAITVLEQLGGPLEHRLTGTAAEWSYPPGDPLNVIAIENTLRPAPHRTRMPGLPDALYEHDGQLTKAEIRALTVAALAPMPGETLWDVGSGSGSIAIEWCRADTGCRAIAFERDPERAARIARNAERLGAAEIEIRGEAPAAFADADDPDAVFIGGGLTTSDVLESCWARLRPGGRLLANAVTMESETALLAAAKEHGGTLRRVEVQHARPLGGFTAWQPRLPIVAWSAVR